MSVTKDDKFLSATIPVSTPLLQRRTDLVVTLPVFVRLGAFTVHGARDVLPAPRVGRGDARECKYNAEHRALRVVE